MKIRITLLILLCVAVSFAIWSRKPHDKGLLYLRMTNYGMFGYENLGIWPKGTNEHYIFGAGVWVGGLHKSHDDTTSLSSACGANDTVIYVYSTAGFAGAGVLFIEDELILYHSTTDTSFNGLVRFFSRKSNRSKKSMMAPMGQNHPQKKFPKRMTSRSTPKAGSIVRITPFFPSRVMMAMNGSRRR